MPSIEITGYNIEKANVVFAGVDETLSIAGRAADAKVTGDRIRQLEGDVSNKLNNFYPNSWINDGDLNQYLTTGFYRIGTGFTHTPYEGMQWFSLEVTAGASQITQKATNLDGYIYFRTLANDNWSLWRQVISTKDAITLDEIGTSANKSGKFVTGDIVEKLRVAACTELHPGMYVNTAGDLLNYPPYSIVIFPVHSGVTYNIVNVADNSGVSSELLQSDKTTVYSRHIHYSKRVSITVPENLDGAYIRTTMYKQAGLPIYYTT